MRLPVLRSTDASNPLAVWQWAKALGEYLNKLGRVVDLANMDLTGKAGYTLKVKADETGFEVVP